MCRSAAALLALVAGLMISVPAAAGDLEDAALHVEVRAALLEQLGLDALDIDIDADADSGRVALHGAVADRAAQELAEEIVRAVDGVKDVSSELTLEESSDDSETPIGHAVAEGEREVKDALLETQVKGRLISEIGRHAFDIEVEAADGVVTLRGAVETDAQQEAAHEAAGAVKGVDRVVDLITVG
jgi:osmotically-inducible protein OsmY